MENNFQSANNTAQQPSSTDGNPIYSIIMLALTFLLPLIVVPLTNNFIVHTKLFLVFAAAILTAGFFLYHSFKNRGWRIVVSPLTLPLVLFGAATLASTLFTQNYPVENLLGYGGIYLCLAAIPLLGGALGEKRSVRWLVPTLAVSASILSITTLLQLLGYGPSHLVNMLTSFELEHNLLFNLAGSSLVAAQFIAIALVGVVVDIIKHKKISILHTMTVPLLVLGLALHLWSLLPGQEGQVVFTPLSASWSVALDSMRAPKSALIGHGPEAYTNIFSRYRPTWLNSTDYWQINFGSGSNLPFTLIVQMGILGLAAWFFLAFKVLFNKNKAMNFKDSPITWMLATTFIIQLLLPPNIVLLGLQALLLLFWTMEFAQDFSIVKLKALSASTDGGRATGLQSTAAHSQTNYWITLGTTGLMFAGLLFATYLTGRAWASYHQQYLANQGYLENDAIQVYDHQRQAVVLNPYLDTHRRTYALTNLQIALALSNKADITEQEQEQVSQLVSQAVREGRAATTIDPLDSRNWVVLAQIYQELVGSAEGADQWAVSAYVEAISNDPSNPLLRLQLGHLLLGQEEFQQAANLYQQATNLKPDLAAGYFHLGNALVKTQQLEQAQQAWKQALILLEAGTEDYQIVEEALAQLEEQIEKQGGTTGQAAQPGTGTGQQPAEGQAQGQTPLSQQLDLTSQNLEEGSEQTVSPNNTTPLELEESPQIAPEEEVLTDGENQPQAPETTGEPTTEEPVVED
jgi:cytochrome c-type biogenesis protein CcmH/NrfG